MSPLVHFFSLGALIFTSFALVNDRPPERSRSANVITMSHEEASRLVEQFTGTWNRPPTPKELDNLVQSWALEEAYVREALSLGLDRDDMVIRQRLSLKMRFLVESGAAALTADDKALRAYLEENPDQFERPPRIAFEQILVPADQLQKIDEIRSRLLAGSDPDLFGQPSLLPPTIPLTAAPLIDRSFGNDFSSSLGDLPVGEWAGPIRSGYGLHLVRITEKTEATLPELSDIRDSVEVEWRATQMQEAQTKFGEALLGRYTVNLPRTDEILQQ